ncbi:hypothetical protein JCM3765_003162 [Sporobolomyces pararoseus]
MEEALDRKPDLGRHVQGLHVWFDTREPKSVPKKEDVFRLLDRFNSLHILDLEGPDDLIRCLLPASGVFTRVATLRNLRLDCALFRSGEFESDTGEFVEVAPFDFESARRGLESIPPDKRLVLNIRKVFDVQLYGEQTLDSDLVEVIKSFPLSGLQVVNFAQPSDLEILLKSIQTPSSLTYLSLHALDNRQDFEPLLAKFVNLQSLSLGGDACLDSEVFYELLSTLPLVELHLGGDVSAADILPLVTVGGSKRIPTLRQLVLDNIDAKIPKVRLYSGLKGYDWFLPCWTAECSREEVEKLQRVAQEAGVETGGTTFLALVIEDTKEWKDMVRFVEEEERARYCGF